MPWFMLFQRTFEEGLYSEKAYYWRELCVSKCVALDNKNSLRQLATLRKHGETA